MAFETIPNRIAECARCGIALTRDAAGWTHTRRHGRKQNHKPIPLPTQPGTYGIQAVASGTPDALSCGTCGRSWVEDITPAGRCPWEYEHKC